MTGFSIRAATESDSPALAHIHVRGWKDAYGGIVDRGFLDSLDEGKRADDWRKWFASENLGVLLAADGEGVPCGFCSFGKLRTGPPGLSPVRPLYTGEIYALYVLSPRWGQGAGGALLRAAVRDLRARKHKSMCLWVLDGNERATSFYKNRGGQRCGKKEIEIGNGRYTELCFGWRDTSIIENNAQQSSVNTN